MILYIFGFNKYPPIIRTYKMDIDLGIDLESTDFWRYLYNMCGLPKDTYYPMVLSRPGNKYFMYFTKTKLLPFIIGATDINTIIEFCRDKPSVQHITAETFNNAEYKKFDDFDFVNSII